MTRSGRYRKMAKHHALFSIVAFAMMAAFGTWCWTMVLYDSTGLAAVFGLVAACAATVHVVKAMQAKSCLHVATQFSQWECEIPKPEISEIIQPAQSEGHSIE